MKQSYHFSAVQLCSAVCASIYAQLHYCSIRENASKCTKKCINQCTALLVKQVNYKLWN